MLLARGYTQRRLLSPFPGDVEGKALNLLYGIEAASPLPLSSEVASLRVPPVSGVQRAARSLARLSTECDRREWDSLFPSL